MVPFYPQGLPYSWAEEMCRQMQMQMPAAPISQPCWLDWELFEQMGLASEVKL